MPEYADAVIEEMVNKQKVKGLLKGGLISNEQEAAICQTTEGFQLHHQRKVRGRNDFTEQQMSHRDMVFKTAADGHVCGVCGGRLTVAWGGAFGI